VERRRLEHLELGPLIRELRRDAGLSQQELADRLGTTQPAVSRWERGHDEPRLARFNDILRACGRRAELAIERDDVDRAQIRQQLAMNPRERLASVANVSRLRATARRA
jgi:transcriptional regulator with XRE-family HTH domain